MSPSGAHIKVIYMLQLPYKSLSAKKKIIVKAKKVTSEEHAAPPRTTCNPAIIVADEYSMNVLPRSPAMS
jgi:hypothetical protein